jgi:formylglycine-generating enzyme required for sulfatase activity
MDWNEAKNACEKLGEGWRLPTKDELDIIYKNRALIGGFGKLQPDYEQTFYWSSSLLADGNNNYYYIHLITEFHTTVMDKNEALSVRAVRTIL